MTRWLCRLLLPLLLTFVAAAPGAWGQGLRPAAVVNDEAISVLDLQMRLRMVMLSSGIQPDRARFQRISEQVLRSLIDERLQMQEARRLGIEVDEAEMQDAVARIAQGNNMAPAEFRQVLKRNGILPEIFEAQVRARLAWQKVIARQIRPELDISEEDVDQVVQRLRSKQGERQLRLREIYLAFGDAKEAAEVRQTAARLIQELRNGANFAALARQFSQSATAAVGGDLGWVTPASLSPEVSEHVARMSPGQVAGPIRTFNGFYIVQLNDTRRISAGEQKVQLKQIFLPLPQGAENGAAAELRARAAEMTSQVEGCEAMAQASQDMGSAASGDLGTLKLSDLPGPIRAAVANLEIGQPSEPIEVNQGIAVLMVCDRESQGIDRDQIRQNLARERANMLAQRYMRDLRRRAHIDIRIQ